MDGYNYIHGLHLHKENEKSSDIEPELEHGRNRNLLLASTYQES